MGLYYSIRFNHYPRPVAASVMPSMGGYNIALNFTITLFGSFLCWKTIKDNLFFPMR
ncbi:MAG: hypothetical protein G01um101413_483 [Parcubacteria group bacterium Gr01-1014_13]|nr:MAG: hypothetical protein G01um101413_483 [Parcubacteria group bacterium Gr01-1014_13]